MKSRIRPLGAAAMTAVRGFVACGHARRLPLFLIVGTVGLGSTNLTLALLHGRIAVVLPLAAAAAWEAGVLTTFTLNNAVTWRSHRERTLRARFVRYQAVGVMGAAIYAGTLLAATSVAGLQYIVASLLGTAVAAIWNYGASHGVVFRRHTDWRALLPTRRELAPSLQPAPAPSRRGFNR